MRGSPRTRTSRARWGAEVEGWDARDTIFLDALDDVEVDIGGEPSPPAGAEVVVSTAHAGRVEGRSRAEFLAELVSLRRAIVVGGAHGKTTTAAMVAYVLRELGHDPAWIVGGVVPQLGGNAGVGEGWLVVEGDESDRSIALLEPEIAAVTNVELDHHAAYGSEAELAGFFDTWLAAAPHAVRGWELEPVTLELAVRGEHNRANAATALAVLARAGVDRDEAERAIASFSGVGRRFELVGERGGVRVIDDYGHNPTEIAATLRTARELEPRALIAVYQPHVYERTRQLHHELGAALGLADAAIVTDVIDGRDAPLPGVTGKLVLDTCRHRRGAAGRRRSRRRPLSRSRGRGLATSSSRWASASRGGSRRSVVEGLARVTRIEHDVPLARLTTIGVGGPARALARPRTVAELVEALRFARDEEPRRPSGRPRLEPARLRRRGRRARRSGSRASWLRSRSTDAVLRAGAARRTPSACTVRATPGSAASSSRARSRAPRAAASS